MLELNYNEFMEIVDKNPRDQDRRILHYLEEANSITLFIKSVDYWKYFTVVPKEVIQQFGEQYEVSLAEAIRDFKRTILHNAVPLKEKKEDIIDLPDTLNKGRVIAIGPRGGRIVGYNNGKPIYEGSSEDKERQRRRMEEESNDNVTITNKTEFDVVVNNKKMKVRLKNTKDGGHLSLKTISNATKNIRGLGIKTKIVVINKLSDTQSAFTIPGQDVETIYKLNNDLTKGKNGAKEKYLSIGDNKNAANVENVSPHEMFEGSIFHEQGHILSFRKMGDYPKKHKDFFSDLADKDQTFTKYFDEVERIVVKMKKKQPSNYIMGEIIAEDYRVAFARKNGHASKHLPNGILADFDMKNLEIATKRQDLIFNSLTNNGGKKWLNTHIMSRTTIKNLNEENNSMKNKESLSDEIDAGTEMIEEADSYVDFLRMKMERWEKRILGFLEETIKDEIQKDYVDKSFGDFIRGLFNTVNTIGFLTGLKRVIKLDVKTGIGAAEKELDMDIGVGVDFDKKVKLLADRQMDGFNIDGKRWQGLKGVAKDIQNDVSSIVSNGINDKQGVVQISKDIKTLFVKNKGGKVKGKVTKGRAMMIARTESNRFINAGKLQAYKDSGLKGKKVWVAFVDERTTDICRHLDGETQDLYGIFEHKGKTYEHPPHGPNCRSVIEFELD